MVTTGYLERDVHVRDLKLHYQEWGSPEAPAILMVHGFGVSGHMFDEFAERMQDRYHLIAIDQRGHGDSDWAPDGDYSRDAFVADLEGFRAALGLDRFVLVGHSMGGLNSVSYTNAYPQHVRALVLVDVGPEAAKEGVENIVRFTRGPDELEFDEFVEMAHRFNQRRSIENIRERMRHRLKPSESGKWTWKFDKRFRQQDSGIRIGSELTNDQSWQLFRDIRVPTLLIRGAESDVLSQEIAERVTREMARARLVVVPAAGHSVPGDNPDDFTAAVREFIADVDQGVFAPIAATEPPPLTQLVEENEARRQRGPGMMTLIVIGVGAAAAIAGLGFLFKQKSAKAKKRRERGIRGRTAAAAHHLPHASLTSIDLETARDRAAALVGELSVVGQRGMSRARHAVADVDIERARHAAAEAVAALAETSRHAAAAAPVKLDRKKAKKRGAKAAKRGRSFSKSALGTSLLIASKLIARQQKPRSRKLPWPR